MKVTLRIADDRVPEGWLETHTAPKRADIQSWARDMVEKFNGELQSGERPRRLLDASPAFPRTLFCKMEFRHCGVIWRAELRADGLHLRRKHSRKFRVLPLVDALMAVQGQMLMKLEV